MHCSSLGMAVFEMGRSGLSGVWTIWNVESSGSVLGDSGDNDLGDFGAGIRFLILSPRRYGDRLVQDDFLPWSFMLTACRIVHDEGSADGTACLMSMASNA